ncbi:pyridoxamine 5'-phosphate oxidase family protein [Catenuloplanes sp. NPDC051500]|uniref:pyridoxamine 5'-phosphate oxidase family protein n=1 Tax=Catenuloplanes sp. NPDC051500 TaxID=3363959 RepID=UPI0037A21331
MDDLYDLVTAYRTCEFATLAKDGTPIVWPTSPWPRPDGTFLVTTSLGFPQKALNVRRDPRVALLFSDPTASGLDRPEQVLVRGTATCPDEIVTDPAGLEAYWTMLFTRQPGSRAYVTPPATWLMDWYYMRLLITVTPDSHVRRDAFVPETRPETTANPLGADRIRAFPSAVLGARDADGMPALARTVPMPDGDGYTLTVPDDVEIVPGPASLLVHRHDEQLSNMKNVLVRGVLTRSGDGWRLTPSTVIEPTPSDSPAGIVRLVRMTKRSMRGYLKRRGLPRPRVPWAAYRPLVAASKR